MKIFFKYLIIILILVIPATSFAALFRSGDQPSIRLDEKIINDVYIAGGNVTSAGMIEGDLITAGGTITVSGDVTGDVMAGGGTINVRSNISDDVRLGGGTINVEGKVGGDVMAGGGQINISGPGVGGDVTLGGGSVRIDAPVAGNVLIGADDVYINAPIAGNVKIEGDKVTLGSKAVISGTLSYRAKQELTKEEGAVVNGEVKFEQRKERKATKQVFSAFLSGFIAWKFFTLLASALLVGMLFRRYSIETINIAIARPWYEMGRGLLVMIALPIISIILFITLIGIPFGVLGIIGFIAMLLFAWIMAPIILGSVVYKYFTKGEFEVSWKTTLFGVIIFTIVGFVPFIGWLAKMLLILLTLGASTALKLKVVKEWR